MNWIEQLFSRRREQQNVTEEIAEHIQEKVEELTAAGMPRHEAEVAARREFGNVALVEEHSREVWQWAGLEAFFRDVRHAFRQLRRSPGFTLTVLFTLALAIGTNTAVFSLVNALLLRPLPYPQPERLGALLRHTSRIDDTQHSGAEEDAQDGETWELVRDNVPALHAAVYSYGSSGVNLQTETAARNVQQQRVSAGYFAVLGINPILGRTFTTEEDLPHGSNAVILSFDTWKTVFFSDKAIIGQSILLKGEPHVVIGVMPVNTHTTAPADLWTPLRPSRTGEGGGDNYHIVARLREGATWAEANAQMAVLRPRMFVQFGKDNPGMEEFLVSRPLQQSLAQPVRTPIFILMAAVAFILLIACANLAGLMLVRVTRRSTELATRLALGATHASILRQLMMEPAILALSGGLLGLGLANAGLKLFQPFLPPDILPLGGLSMDYRVLGFAFLASLATTLLTGILPVFAAHRAEIRPSLAAGNTRSANAIRTRTRQGLIAAEVTLTVVLLGCAGLLIRTLVHLETLPPGFDASNVMTAQVSLDDARYHTAAAFHQLLQKSLAAMKLISGVESAAMGLSLPFERGLNDGFYLADGPNAGKNDMSSAVYITPEYFHALSIPLLSGRSFTEGDTGESQPVVIVNEAFARKFFHTTDVVGRHLRFGRDSATVLIVGVVGDVTKRPGLMVNAPLDTEVTYYVPAAQVGERMLKLVHVWFQPSWIVRTNGSVPGIREAMQSAMGEADPNLPVAGVHPLSDFQALALQQQKFEVLLLSVLAGLALLLSLVGVYGLVSSMVVQRTREIGIRMALGSSVHQAMVEIGSSGIAAVALGLLAGVGLSAILVPVIKSELYGVKAYDAVTLIAILLLLILAAAAAIFAPTLRIARIDPAATLRAE